MRSVFNQGDALIGKVEENDRSTEHADCAKHLDVQQMADAHKRKNKHFTKDALEAHVGRELVVRDRTHDAGDVVQNHEGQQRIEQAVAAAEKVAEPAANGGEDELNGVLNSFILFSS